MPHPPRLGGKATWYFRNPRRHATSRKQKAAADKIFPTGGPPILFVAGNAVGEASCFGAIAGAFGGSGVFHVRLVDKDVTTGTKPRTDPISKNAESVVRRTDFRLILSDYLL